MRPVKAKMSFQFRSCTIRRKIQICETKLPMARQKIAGILCVFQDFLTQSAAILAAKICVEAIGTASYIWKGVFALFIGWISGIPRGG